VRSDFPDSVGVRNSNEAARYKSDLYVFCFQHEKDYDRWNALDLSQWEFYIRTRNDLGALNISSISLRKLRELQQPIFACEFREAFEKIVSRYQLKYNSAAGASAAFRSKVRFGQSAETST
jgi:hypothetical protein